LESFHLKSPNNYVRWLLTWDWKPFAEIEPGIEKTDPAEGDHQGYVNQAGEIKDTFKDSGKACLIQVK